MNGKVTSAVALVACVVCSAAPVSGQTAEAAVDRAVAAYKPIKTARGTFEQRLTLPTRSVYNSRGDFQQRMPGELSVVFSDPKNDRIVVDGKALWLYAPSTNPGHVTKVPVGSGVGATVDLIGRFIDSPKTRYHISLRSREPIDGRPTTAVRLVPIQPSADFDTATVWIDDRDGLIRQFETRESTGILRRIHLLTFVPNAPVDASAFTFVVPKGVQVDQYGGGRGGRP